MQAKHGVNCAWVPYLYVINMNRKWVTTVRSGDTIIVGDVTISIIKSDGGKLRVSLSVPSNIKIIKSGSR